MTIGLYTSKRYFDLKKAAVEEAAKKLGLQAALVDDGIYRPSLTAQSFGFEELFKRARSCAAEAAKREGVDIGVGIENSLSFIYNADEWYYVICTAVCTKDGRQAESFTPGISVPLWMVKEVQQDNVKIDAVTQNLAGQEDPVMYFSANTLTRKDLMTPSLLLALSNLHLEKKP